MADLNSIGLLELTSVAVGYMALDAMLKAASVEILLARSICSGKYLIAVAGDVASVQAAVEAGARLASGTVIESKLDPGRGPVVPACRGDRNLTRPAGCGKIYVICARQTVTLCSV